MPLECVQIPPGTILAGYRVESELGRGNNGVVYLAEQQSLGRQVAFKILLPELAAEPRLCGELPAGSPACRAARPPRTSFRPTTPERRRRDITILQWSS